jgi:hypothetical protein
LKPVAVSKFADIEYCELKVVHHFVNRLKPSFHPCVGRGAAQHAESAAEDSRRPKVAVPLGELLSSLKDGESIVEFPSESVRVEFRAHGFTFSGRLDKLLKTGGDAIVVDEKFSGGNSEIFMRKYEAQLSAYCYGLANGRTYANGVALGENVFNCLKLSCIIVGRDIATRERLGEPKRFEYSASAFEPALSRFANVVKGAFGEKELACNSIRKCAACEYRLECGHRAY